ncbi:MAG: hypothetical protein AB1714_17060 [Acidobacteriota bacterium]
MSKPIARLAILVTAIFCASAILRAAPQEKWLHVKVEERSGKGEVVKVNVPLSLAEKLLPLIQSEDLKGGKVRIQGCHHGEIDLPGILAAVRDAQDGEYVTVEGGDEDVRVAKQNGLLLITVRGKRGDHEKVDVRLPMTIAESLTSTEKGEIDLLSMIRALQSHGDMQLVSVESDHETVGVWIDGRNTID